MALLERQVALETLKLEGLVTSLRAGDRDGAVSHLTLLVSGLATKPAPVGDLMSPFLDSGVCRAFAVAGREHLHGFWSETVGCDDLAQEGEGALSHISQRITALLGRALELTGVQPLDSGADAGDPLEEFCTQFGRGVTGHDVCITQQHVSNGAMGLCITGDRAKVSIAQMAVASYSSSPPRARSTLPDLEPFHGRQTELLRLDAELFDRTRHIRLALVGAAGVGKTHLAVEYARLHRERYTGGTFYIQFDRESDRLRQLHSAFPGYADSAEACQLLAGVQERTLLIYDGVGSDDELQGWLPPPVGAHVLVTSANVDWPKSYRVHRVEPLSRADATQLARHHLGDELNGYCNELVQRAAGNARALIEDATAVARSSLTCPYPGLESFKEDDCRLFFGRSRTIVKLMDRVRKHAVVGVFGRSGSGKSSLVSAGLIASLRKQAPRVVWDVVRLRPGEQPLHELVAAIVDGFGKTPGDPAQKAPEVGRAVARVRKRGAAALWELLRQRSTHASKPPDRLLIAIDQWEELYATASRRGDERGRHSNEVDAFLNVLKSLASDAAPMPVHIVATVRADYYRSFCDDTSVHGHSPSHDVHVGPLGASDILEAIERPAREAGVVFDPPSLPKRIAEDAGFDEALLPLLQYALSETWKRREGLRLTAKGYAATGGVSGALTQMADSTYEQLEKREKAAARLLFLKLVIPGEGRLDTGARIAKPPHGSDEDRVVRKFAAEEVRLLVIGTDANRSTVGCAHEGLIRQWTTLRDWIDDKREALHLRAMIVRHRDEWENSGRRDDALLTGFHLDRAGSLLRQPDEVPVDDLRNFINCSELRAAREKQRDDDERRRHQRQNRFWLWSLGLLSVLIALFAVKLRTTLKENSVLLDHAQQDAESLRQSLERAKEARRNLRQSVVGLVTARVSSDIVAQGHALSKLAADPRMRGLLEGSALSTANALAAHDDLLEVPQFHSVLLLDESGCPVVRWPFKAAPATGRASALQACKDNIAKHLPVEEIVTSNWWLHNFDFREYFVRARALVEGAPRPYVVVRTFESEDDDKLKYAISVPIHYGSSSTGVLVGTAPPELTFAHPPPDLVTGLLGFQGRERNDKDPDVDRKLLLLHDRRGQPPDSSPTERERKAMDIAQSVNEWSGKNLLFQGMDECALRGGDIHEKPWTDDQGRAWQVALQPIDCAGLVSFAATLEAR